MNYEEQVGELINDHSMRRELGYNLSQIIKKDHITGWNGYLQAIYQALPQTHTVLKEYTDFGQWAEDDLVWACLQYKTGFSYLYKDQKI
jgi:hypothetical protein